MIGKGNVVSLKLSKIAEGIARQHGAKGCVIVITGQDENFQIGFDNLNPLQIQDAGCAVIHTAFEEDEKVQL
jgi:hypothetical protein